MSKPESDLKLINHFFKQGSKVEISSYDKSYLGSWFNGTVLRLNIKSFSAVVEYESRKDENEELPLIQKVDLIQLRPQQKVQQKGHSFAVSDYVDVFRHNGWWEGIVTELYGEKKLVVFFKHTGELRLVKVSKSRPHQEWVFGKWIPELDEVPVKSPAVKVPVSKKRGVVDEVPLKSLRVEVTPVFEKRIIQSQKNEVPATRERKIQSREIDVPFRKYKTRSREVEVPAFKQRKIQSPEVEVPAFEKHQIKPRKVEVPAVKKLQTGSRDELYSPAKDIPLTGAMRIIPLSAIKPQEVEGPAFEKHKIQSGVPAFKKLKIQSRYDLYSPSKSNPSTADMQIVPLSAKIPIPTNYTPSKEQAKYRFEPGQFVETSNHGDGFEGAWFPGTVVQTLNAKTYLVKHKYIPTEDEKSRLTEEVDSQHMRPCPPEVTMTDRFSTLEDVDAFYNDCWWAGVIARVLKDDEYIVYFGASGEEIKFRHSQLRVHRSWINGRWVIPQKALEL